MNHHVNLFSLLETGMEIETFHSFKRLHFNRKNILADKKMFHSKEVMKTSTAT
jgi:hypothetical protein